MGVKEVFHCVDSSFDRYHSEAYAAAVTEVIKNIQPEVVLASASSLGKDLLPRLAARFDAHIVSDAVEVELGDQARVRRPYYSGKASAELRVPKGELFFLSLRPNALPAGRVGDSSGKVTLFKPIFDFASSKIQFLEQTKAVSDRPDLAEASTIVSGGRSLKSRENFKILFELADVLGAAVGASRAAVDEGLADHSMQVGQTGKTVNPNLYFAFGISGAIQHLAGMRTSKVIVAINKDAQAPIFSKADYGIVGDLFELVPLLTEEAKKQL
jgi:electron transfer flavoprotein alpha subunit